MREIKFRTWNKITCKWVRSDELLQDTEVSATILEPSILTIEHSEWIFQQFTGLKDKTGKEIYEGDILYDSETDDEGNDISTQFEVEYSNQLACYVIDNSYKRDGSFYIGIIDYFGLENLEVVGNIYENPELLK